MASSNSSSSNDPSFQPLPPAESLALAVLRKDESAIGPLVDLLSEQYGTLGGKVLSPIANTQLAQVKKGRLRAIFFIGPDADVDQYSLESAYFNWLYYQEPLVLVGVQRVEFYEMPEWAMDINTGTGSLDDVAGGPLRREQATPSSET
jgi:hypothetical protein